MQLLVLVGEDKGALIELAFITFIWLEPAIGDEFNNLNNNLGYLGFIPKSRHVMSIWKAKFVTNLE